MDLVNDPDSSLSNLVCVWDVVGVIIRSHIAEDSPGPKLVGFVM